MGEGFHCLNQGFHVGRTCTNKDKVCTWSLAWARWQIGLNCKFCFDATSKDEELNSMAIWREDKFWFEVF